MERNDGRPTDDENIATFYSVARGMYEKTYGRLRHESPGSFHTGVINGMARTLPEFEEDGKYYAKFRDLSRTKGQTFEDLFELGVDIGETLTHSKNDRAKTLGFVSSYVSMFQIEAAVKGGTGRNPKPSRDTIAQIAAHTLIETMPDHEKNHQIFTSIYSVINDYEERHTYGKDSLEALFFNMSKEAIGKLVRLNGELQFFKRNVRRRYSEPTHETQPEYDVDAMSNVLTVEAMAHRKYGVKSAYTEASIGGSWLFYGADSYKGQLHHDNSTLLDNLAAAVYHVPETNLKDLRLKPTSRVISTDGGMQAPVVGGAAEHADFPVFIMKDGTMSFDLMGLHGIEYVLRDTPDIAKLIKAEVAANFYDLSMPVYEEARALKNFSTLSEQLKEDFDPIEDLLVPRIRLLNKLPEPPSDVKRSVREHDVVWFVRTLPAGWHASPEAIQEALSRGIILEDNETFVREHTRGSIASKALGVHAIKRAR